MKKILYSFLIALIGLGVTSCSHEKMPGESNTTGQVDFRTLVVTYDESVDVLRSTDVSNFMVKVFEASTNNKRGEWLYSELPDILTLTTGKYKLVVESCELQNAAWETPYYHAEQEFTIEVDKITAIGDVVCSMKNVKVSIEFDHNLLAIMGDDCKVHIALGKGELDFTANETRAGYFAITAETNSIYATFSGTVDGYFDTIYREIINVKAGEWRIIRFSIKDNGGDNTESGSFSPSLTIDISCTVVNHGVQIEIDDEEVIEDPEPSVNPDEPTPDEPGTGDEPDEPAVGPVITADGFDIDEPQTVVENMTVVVHINSESPIAEFTVDIDSPKLTDEILTGVGLSSHLDMASPGALKDALKGLGLPVEEEVLGQTYVKFDITSFCPLLGIYGAATHNFIMNVTDEAGNTTTKTLTLITE